MFSKPSALAGGLFSALVAGSREQSVCWYITMAVPPSAEAEISAFAVSARHVSVERSLPTSACLILPRDSVKFLITHVGCSCSIYHASDIRPKIDDGKRRSKLSKRGWSAQKIERAVSESHAAVDRNWQARSAAQMGALSEFRELVSLVAAKFGVVALYCHSYRGSIFTEELPVPTTSNMTIAQFANSPINAETIVSVAG